MGYTTEFEGAIDIVPPLDADEINFLKSFCGTRRMFRRKGPYFVLGTGHYGQGHDEDVLDYNRPPEGQPGLWCQWEPSDDGTQIHWDQGEKFSNAKEWMRYLIEHFLKPGALAIGKVPGIKGGHICNGEIEAQGQDGDDRWDLIVENNVVTIARYGLVRGPRQTF